MAKEYTIVLVEQYYGCEDICNISNMFSCSDSAKAEKEYERMKTSSFDLDDGIVATLCLMESVGKNERKSIRSCFV